MDLRKKLIDYFYDVNVRADIKIESLVDDILMDVDEYIKELKIDEITSKYYGDCTICGHPIKPVLKDGSTTIKELVCPKCGAVFCY